VYLVTSEQMQLFDKQTIETRCVPGIVLMENAGKEVALRVAEKKPKCVLVLCGKGNNGGDGWVIARWLKHLGIRETSVVSTIQPELLSGDALIMYRAAVASGVEFVLDENLTSLADADVYVDALLGTGGKGFLRGSARRLAEMLNAKKDKYVVSVDLPSGVDASTGKVEGPVVQADETITFAFQKLGTAVTPGAYCAGFVHVVDIGIERFGDEPLATLVGPEQFLSQWPKRHPSAHKGTFGRLLVMMGEMEGAALLAASGGARIGSGLVAVGGLKRPTCAVPPDFVISAFTRDKLLQSISHFHALVLGPGLGSEIQDYEQVLTSYEGTGVLDADGLRLIHSSGCSSPKGSWVVTPHPKECAGLLGWSTEDVQANRVEAATSLAKRTASVVVLKGYHALIASPDGELLVNPTGDASLAVAGTGDVLAGMIGGLLAQGLKPIDAAALGTWLHGAAGELAGQRLSPVSTIASDIIDSISRAIRCYFDKEPGTHL
jgi:ADP-dependent NAD(P)H-hydrate dehydratase / NAD(P)H-hydrate epimerase